MRDQEDSSNKDANVAQLKISIAVIGSYFFKSIVKLVGGSTLSIPPLVADGIHGLVDILEHGLLVLAGRHARKPDREKYPLDREPLIELTGVAIFTGLFFVGLTFFREAVKTIAAVVVNAHWISLELPAWVIESLPELSVPDVNVLWIAALILFLCFTVTEFVYRFQSRLAIQNKLREMEDDAKELRSDGWLELAMFAGFASGWIAIMIVGRSASSEALLNTCSLVTGIVLLGLSIYLMILSVSEIYPKYQNLMNVAINRKERTQLEKIINERLPERCRVYKHLIAYYRGQQLFVTGHIYIDRSLMISADSILRRAEFSAEGFLSNLSDDIHVQFSPLFFYNEESIVSDLNSVLDTIWSVSPYRAVAEAFRMLRKGQIDKAKEVILEDPPKDANERSLAAYINAEISLRNQGTDHPETKHASENVLKLLDEDLPLPVTMMLASWFLIYIVQSTKNSFEGQADIVAARDRLVKLMNSTNHIPDIARAEASFALGYSWERCHAYDLRKSIDFYRSAELHYAKSGIRSESDRLMNTWGHLETLMYFLGDAQVHLELSLEIRKLKRDPIGLSFNYGCLGDLYSRLGDFSKANTFYNQDIDLLSDLEIRHQIPLVMCKQGEAQIRGGLAEKDSRAVLKGISLCRESGILDKSQNHHAQFFAKKGQIKGWLGLVAISTESSQITHYQQQCSELICDFRGGNDYENAFASRLNGRYEGLNGDLEKAVSDLDEAANYFDKMIESRFEIALRLQSIACRIEMMRHKIANDAVTGDDLAPVEELEDFLEPLGGMLGDAAERIKEIIDRIRTSCTSSPVKKEDALNNLDLLVWFIEG